MSHEVSPAEIDPFMYDVQQHEKPQDECGVYGVYAPGEEVAALTYDGLHSLQHRGQSGAGVSVIGASGSVRGHKGNGLVDVAIAEAVPRYSIVEKRTESPLDEWTHSPVAVGHVRYSTSENEHAAQPFTGRKSTFALAHNGHIEFINKVADGFGVDHAESLSDSHTLSMILDAKSAELGSINAALAEVLPKVEGAYCLTIMDKDQLIGVRDPWGFHPLALGQLDNGKGFVLASESVAFESGDVTFVRDIEPGEIITITKDGCESSFIERLEPKQNCMFEYIYIARPDSIIDGVNVYSARKNMGRHLAEIAPVDADVVVGVPASGLHAAAGFAAGSGIPLVEGLFKNTYSNRSFIEREGKRDVTLRRKLRPNVPELEGQRVVLVDDSLIKGSVMKVLIGMVRNAGAKEVHVRLAAPRYEQPCYMGMDTRDAWRLAAHGRTNEEIAEMIGADSVGFNSVEGVDEAIQEARISESVVRSLGDLCTGCTTGKYPFPVPVTLGMPRQRHEEQLLVALSTA